MLALLLTAPSTARNWVLKDGFMQPIAALIFCTCLALKLDRMLCERSTYRDIHVTDSDFSSRSLLQFAQLVRQCLLDRRNRRDRALRRLQHSLAAKSRLPSLPEHLEPLAVLQR